MSIDTQSRSSEEGNFNRVSKNAGYYLIVQMMSWINTLVHLIVAPRVFGSALLGKLYFVDSIVSTVSVFFIFCFENYLVVEIAKSEKNAEKLIRSTFGLRLLLTPIFAILSFSIMGVLKLGWLSYSLGLICVLGVVANFFIGPMRSLLAGTEQAKRITVLSIICSFTGIFSVMFMSHGIVATMYATLFIGMVVPLALLVVWLRKETNLTPVFDLKLSRQLYIGGSSFFANTILLTLYSASSMFILKKYADEAMIGTFFQANKLSGTLLFVPTVITMAILPSTVRLGDTNSKNLDKIQTRVFVLIVISALCICAQAWVLGDSICNVIYGSRFPGLAMAFKASVVQNVPLYITSTLYVFLVARGKNGVWSYFLLGSVILNVLLSWVMIPAFQVNFHNAAVGAVNATTVAEFATAICAIFLLRIKLLEWNCIVPLLKALLATVTMVACIYPMRNLFFIYPAVLGGIVFVAMIYFLKAIDPEDQRKLIAIFKKTTDKIFGSMMRRRG